MSHVINIRLVFRLIRTQVQIRSSKEKTRVILKKIRNSKVIEQFMVLLLIVNTVALAVKYLPANLINQVYSSDLYFYVYGPTDVTFMSLFFFQMRNVNQQFFNFFKQIQDHSYPYKTIRVILAILYLVNLVSNIMRFITGLNPSLFPYYFLTLVLNLQYELFFLVLFSFFLLYMADVDFDEGLKNTSQFQKGLQWRNTVIDQSLIDTEGTPNSSMI